MVLRNIPIILLVNCVGLAAYIYFASAVWLIPGEETLGGTGQTSEAFIWFLSAFPTLVVFLIINLVLALRSWARIGLVKTVGIFCVVAGAWTLAVMYDFYRQG